MTELIPKPADWNHVMIQMAFTISQMSKDPSTKVGAIVVSPNRELVSFGYNGFPKSIPDDKKWWENRGEDPEDFTKYDLVCHAESNAMSQPNCDLTGWYLYVTHFPCLNCALRAVREGIKKVYYCLDPDHMKMDQQEEKVKKLFALAGIELTQITLEK